MSKMYEFKAQNSAPIPNLDLLVLIETRSGTMWTAAVYRNERFWFYDLPGVAIPNEHVIGWVYQDEVVEEEKMTFETAASIVAVSVFVMILTIMTTWEFFTRIAQ